MKILFCIYRLDFADHISLAYLSAVAKRLNHSTYLCVMQDSNLYEKIKEIKPDIVAYSANIYGFKELTSAHKAARKSFQFVSIMGGPHCTFYPDTIKDAGVDAYCIGEGEGAFHDFLQRVEHGKSFDDLPNINTSYATNSVRPLLMNLDEIPFPDRDITLANSYLKNTPKKTFYATRGCPFRCKYCANNYYHKLYHGRWAKLRRFSVDRLINEIEYVNSRYRMDFVKFGDDLFAMKADQWLVEFTKQYKRRIGVAFNCYLRFDTVDSELLSLLKEAGCYSVHLAVDSTSEHVREKILGRQMKKVDIAEKLRMIKSYGINTWVNYMLAAPESTLSDDINTIALNKKGKVSYASYSTTVPMPGTALYDYCLENKLIAESIDKADLSGVFKTSTLNCFSKREKNIRFNIFLLGAVIAKLPFPLDFIAIQLIKIIPPNRIFQKIRHLFYTYNIQNIIFKISSK